MAAVDDIKEEGFSFIWTIQNISYCVQYKDEALKSPIFIMKDNESDNWCLNLYPKGSGNSDTIALKLQYVTQISNNKELSFELTICTPMGIFKQSGDQKEMFNYYNSEHSFESVLRLKDVNKKRSGAHLKTDSLTVTCRIFEVNNKRIASEQCHVRTVIAVERTTYIWTLDNIMELGYKRPIKRPPISSEISSFTMELASIKGAFADDKIQIEIKSIEKINNRLFSTCEMSLLGVDGEIVYSVRDEYCFGVSKTIQIWKLSFILINKILSRKELYLPNGTLSLRCEFAVSSGAKYNEVETSRNVETEISKLEHCKQENESDFKCSLKDNLQCFYAEGKFSDLTIRSPNKEFRVHKTILCARSEVFSAMFERDMKENLTGVVDIKDVDDDTVSKMLLFVYTDTVGEDLEFETASSLYFAADKYGIVALKRKCSDFFKGNFTVTNICDVLVLADRHQDQELKSDAQNFIFEHSGEIMESEEWKQLIKEKVSLAAETMHAVLRRS